MNWKPLANRMLGTKESLEFAERMAIGLAVLLLSILQVLLASQVLTDNEATQLAELFLIGGYAVSPWHIISAFVLFYVGMAGVRWNAGFLLALSEWRGDSK